MNTADALARILAIEGVQQVFFFPGSPMTEALARAGIRLILTRQERVAGDMADGMSRSTNGRQIGVFAVQSLAGAENAYAGVVHAWTDSTPTLFLPGHPGLARIGEPPTFEALDHFRMITKYRARIGSPEVLGDKMRQAFMALRSGRPGPAMVELPEDVLAEPFDAPIDHRVVRGSRPGPDDGAVSEAAELLLRAEHPLIWAGQGALYAEASDALVEVAELLGAPVMTTLQGKSAMPEDHPLAAGVGGYAQTPMVVEHLARCDVLLVVGSSLSRTDFTPVVPAGKTIIHATIDPVDLEKSYPTEVAITSDARLFLERLAERLRDRVGEAQAARSQRRAAELADDAGALARGLRAELRVRLVADRRVSDVPRALGPARSRPDRSSRTNRARRATSSRCSTPRRRRAATSAGASRRSWATQSGRRWARSSRTRTSSSSTSWAMGRSG